MSLDEQNKRLAVVEVLAAEVVKLLQQFIDRLREVFTAKNPSQGVLLYNFQSSTFVRDVERLCESVEKAIPSSKWAENTLNTAVNNDDQRYLLVHRILHPLLEALTRCYGVLDKVTSVGDRANGKRPTPPPPGLLSLRNYTDIAATLEFLVSTSILPLIDFTFQRKKSNTLAKRLPPVALQWGKSSFNKESGNGERELQLTVRIIHNILQLDRFRPMLFARHVMDLFAGKLQLDHWQLNTVSLQLEPVLEASACQTLLSSTNQQSPSWLRKRLSAILQHLAETNIMAIFNVFLVGEEASTAALRLARTLLTTVEPHHLCQSILRILDKEPEQAIIWQTIWAILDGLPSELQVGVLPTEPQCFPTTFDRIRILFATSPPRPFVQADTVLRLMLASGSNEESTMSCLAPLSLILRLSALPTVFTSTVKQCCHDIIRGLVMYFEQKEDCIPLAIAVAASMAPTQWDLQHKLRITAPEDLSPEQIQMFEGMAIEANLEDLVRTIIEPMVTTVLKSFVGGNTTGHVFDTQLIQVLLCFLVHEHPGRFENLSLVSMVAMPIVVETVDLEKSIGENVLDLVSLVLIGSWESSIMAGALKKLSPLLPQSTLKLQLPNNGELVNSMKGLLLSVLVSILELGSRLRDDEEKLQALQPVLVSLAQEEDDTVSAEFREMASHAAALIASRRQRTEENEIKEFEEIRDLRAELASEHPALRARAIVSLRHQFEDAIQSRDENKLQSLLKLALIGLRDTESYVYLAAIHIIAAAGDQAPSVILPLTAQVFVSGEYDDEILSLDQRAKLCEALIFMIRRRGGIYEYIDVVLRLMLHGSTILDDASISTTDSLKIQSETHNNYARAHGDEGHEDSTNNEEEEWTARDFRLKAGGPIFSVEESEVVRAGMISVVAELVITAHSSSLVPFCYMLTMCAIDSLQLGGSRQIRRAGALLAREIYGALRREEEEVMELMERRSRDHGLLLSQVISPWEEKLAVSIERCANRQDLEDLETSRFHDAAVCARCNEAFSLRADLKQSGFLALARAAYELNRQIGQNPVARMLEEKKLHQKPSRKVRIEEL